VLGVLGRKIELKFFGGAGDGIFQAHAKLAGFHFKLMMFLFDGAVLAAEGIDLPSKLLDDGSRFFEPRRDRFGLHDKVLLLLDERDFRLLGFRQLALDAPTTFHDCFGAADDAGDLLLDLRFRRGLALDLLLAGELLFLDLAQQHASGCELLAPQLQVLGNLCVTRRQLFDHVLMIGLILLQCVAAPNQLVLFGLKLAGLIEQVFQLALQHRLLATQG
jgi:hypothetical protein